MKKLAGDGREIEIRLIASGAAWYATIIVAGRILSDGFGLSICEARAEARAKGCTHEAGSGKITIGLSAAEAEILRGEIEAIEAAIRVSPAGLRSQRKALAGAVQAAVDAVRYARERAYEESRPIPSYDGAGDKEAEALAEFDRQHPEVVAAINKERAEATERAVWM